MKKIIMILFFVLIALTSIVSVCAIDIDNHNIETNNSQNVLLGEPAYTISDNIHNNSYPSQDNIIEIENKITSNSTNNNNKDNLINDGGKYNSNIDEKDFRMISNIAIINQSLQRTDLTGLQTFIDEVPKGSTLDLHEDMKNNGKENKIVNIIFCC